MTLYYEEIKEQHVRKNDGWNPEKYYQILKILATFYLGSSFG